MTLECEDAKSKLVEVVTLADAGICVVEIWKLTFCLKVELFQTLRTSIGQDFEVWLIFIGPSAWLV